MRAALNLLAIAQSICATSVAAQSFDLECLRGPASISGNIKERYQIDVSAGQWCLGECRTIKPIVRSDSSVIALEDDELFGDTVSRQFELDTGILVYNFALGTPHEQHIEYHCRRGPFGGLKINLAEDASPGLGFGGFINSAGFLKGADGQELQGVVGFRANIDAEGRLLNCEIVRSSGLPELDRYACDTISRYAKWRPAKDRGGNPVAGVYESAVRWIMS